MNDRITSYGEVTSLRRPRSRKRSDHRSAVLTLLSVPIFVSLESSQARLNNDRALHVPCLKQGFVVLISRI
jgi:hypothetical protein